MALEALFDGFIGKTYRCRIMHGTLKTGAYSNFSVDPITYFIILKITCMGLLIKISANSLGGANLSLREKCALILLLDLGAERYNALLCVWRYISLAMYFTSVFGLDAQ